MNQLGNLEKLRIQECITVRKTALHLGIELEEGDITFERGYSLPLIGGMDAYEWLHDMGDS